MTEITSIEVPEFRAWPKIPRLNRETYITEKIDGTNACVIIDEEAKLAYAQSRKHIIFPNGPEGENIARNRGMEYRPDNATFAQWVYDNEKSLAQTLGPGYHYGEWWGKGIQRGYDLDEKRFSLFNFFRWRQETDLFSTVKPEVFGIPQLDVVPVLMQTPVFDTNQIQYQVERLRQWGPIAAPGFMRPEGVIAFHPQGNVGFKVTLEKDEEYKGKQNG